MGNIEHKQINAAGFSLLEILISVAILVIIMSAGVPVVIRYYSTYRTLSAQQDLISLLRRAQSQAMTNQFGDTYGLSISTSSNKFIVFRGASYASRTVDFDNETLYSTAINITGPTEIVFSQLSGRPNTTGTITVTDNRILKTIEVNSEGMVNW